MSERDDMAAAMRALYTKLQSANQCLVNVHRLLSPPLPYRMKKLNLIRCIEAARLEIEAYNAQAADRGGAGGEVHEDAPPLPGRDMSTVSTNRNIIIRGRR